MLNMLFRVTLLCVVTAMLASMVVACVPVAAPAVAPDAGNETAAPTSGGEAAAPTTESEAAAPASSGPAIGIVLPSQYGYWIQNETRFKELLASTDMTAEILFSQYSSAMEKENVESLLAKGIKVIILAPFDSEAAAPAAEAAKAAGASVISYDRLILGTDAVDFYVTFDNDAVGATQAQYLVDKATGAGNPLFLYAGAAADNNAFQFFDGAWKVLQPKIADGTFVIKNSSAATALQDKATLTHDEIAKIIDQITTNWDFYSAESLAAANLNAVTPADKGNVFILAPNDGTARVIANVFADDVDITSYVVAGQDGDKESIQSIIDGRQSMTALKDLRMLAAAAISAATDYLDGQIPPQTTTFNNGTIDVPADPVGVIAVDKDNVKAAVIDSGYFPASDFTGLE